jgi:hypothetical protein
MQARQIGQDNSKKNYRWEQKGRIKEWQRLPGLHSEHTEGRKIATESNPINKYRIA